jgi:hypothetical protein
MQGVLQIVASHVTCPWRLSRGGLGLDFNGQIVVGVTNLERGWIVTIWNSI